MRHRWLLALLAAVGLVRGARATTFVPLTDAELVRHADLIAIGLVRQIETLALDDERIVTRVTLGVTRTIKGRIAGDTIVLTEPGGEVGDRLVRIYGAPEFESGETVLVFLRRTADGSFQTDNLALGKYHLDGGVAARVVPTPDVRHQQRFLAALARHADGAPGITVGADEAQALRGRVRQRSIVTEFTFLGSPIARWFQPDSGQPVRYGQANTDAALGSASTSALAAALAAWTNVPTASITVALGAATTPAPSAGGNRCDGTSRVQFNDPFSEVSELINCHGTLAIGGFCTNSESRVVGGNTFRRITEGDVTVNNGIGTCFTATDLAEVLTHELGHTIGLGHSSNNTNELNPALRDATMYYRAHFDGRGAALRADDVAGVTTIYPGDRDHDGVGDGDDACPDTLTGEAVDASGCACSDPRHVSCDDGDACTIDDCRASSGACAHTAIRCGDGDPCSIDSCSAGECLHAAAVGTRYVTCYFDTPLACDATVPAAVRRSFQQAAALARRASAANAIVNTERLFRRADRRLTRASTAIDRAMVRRRAPIDAACGAALHEIVDEALGRVRAVEH